MSTEKEKMLAGELYDPADPELFDLRTRTHDLCLEFNLTKEADTEKRAALLKELVPHMGKGTYLTGPVHFDYGCFTFIGENSYANFDLTVLDICPVTIGNNVFIGPKVSLLTPMHPFLWQERNLYVNAEGVLTDREYGKPITIEDNCWIAGNVTVCGGVTIGEGSIIGAGSVVTRNIPKNSLAAGNPCRVIREITEADSIKYGLK